MTETIQHSTGDYRGDGTTCDRWLILDVDHTTDDPHGIIAGLWVDPDTREILQVEVHPTRQREGLATQLWAAATSTSTVLHAPATHRTTEGDAFAQAIGGGSAPCLHGCCTTEED
ncbi:MAG: hypothetical protein RJA59_737 [Pseudomonadota bacterium]|jgi:GNAT superfamily N-acetyltransferase